MSPPSLEENGCCQECVWSRSQAAHLRKVGNPSPHPTPGSQRGRERSPEPAPQGEAVPSLTCCISVSDRGDAAPGKVRTGVKSSRDSAREK